MKYILLLSSLFLVGCESQQPIQPVVVQAPVEISKNKPLEEFKEKVCVITGANITAWLKSEFVENYEYEDSEGYMFALKINDKYYDVYRNENDGVSNSVMNNLLGAVSARTLNELGGYTWYIPFNTKVKVAKKKGNYGFEYTVFTGIESLSMSTTKETADIAEFQIDYVKECK